MKFLLLVCATVAVGTPASVYDYYDFVEIPRTQPVAASRVDRPLPARHPQARRVVQPVLGSQRRPSPWPQFRSKNQENLGSSFRPSDHVLTGSEARQNPPLYRSKPRPRPGPLYRSRPQFAPKITAHQPSFERQPVSIQYRDDPINEQYKDEVVRPQQSPVYRQEPVVYKEEPVLQKEVKSVYHVSPHYQGERPPFERERPHYEEESQRYPEYPKYQEKQPQYQEQLEYEDEEQYQEQPKYQLPLTKEHPKYESERLHYKERPKYQAERPKYQAERPEYQEPPKYQNTRPQYQEDRPQFAAGHPLYKEVRPQYDDELLQYNDDLQDDHHLDDDLSEGRIQYEDINDYGDHGVNEFGAQTEENEVLKEKRQALHHDGGGHFDENGEEFAAQAARVENAKGAGRLAFQIHGQLGPDSYRFGYDTGKGYNRQFRYEERDGYGQVHGRYGFYDKDGKLQVVNYSAHPEHGFTADVPH